jgi:chromosome segregation ATPase
VHQVLLKALEAAKVTAVKQHELYLALEAKVSEFAERRGDAYTALAKHYLPELSEDKIQQNFRGVQDELRGIAAAAIREREKVIEQIRPVQQTCSSFQNQVNDLTYQLNLLVQRREQLEGKLSETLKTHEQFQRYTKQAIETRNVLDDNSQRISEIQQEAKEKLPAYQTSSLFQYLYRRKFGTAKYVASGMARNLDGWVARLIDYGRARRSYEFLQVTPELMKLEWERRKDEFRQLRRDIDVLEEKIAEEIGLNVVAAEGVRLGEQRDEVIEQLDRQAGMLEPLEKKLDDLEHVAGEHYQAALERLRDFLNEVRPETLARHIQRTPQEEDDDLLREINWLESEIESLQNEARRLSRDQKEATKKLEGLDYVVRRFQRSNFNSDRCYFDDLHVENLLKDFDKDRINQHNLLKKIRAEHKFHPTWVDSMTDKAEGALENPVSQAVFSAIEFVASTTMEQIAKRGRGMPLIDFIDDGSDDDSDDQRKGEKEKRLNRRDFSKHRGF